MKITEEKRPIVLGQEPTMGLKGGGADAATCLRLELDTPGRRVVLAMSPNEARDLGCMLIVAAASELAKLEANEHARVSSLLGGGRQ